MKRSIRPTQANIKSFLEPRIGMLKSSVTNAAEATLWGSQKQWNIWVSLGGTRKVDGVDQPGPAVRFHAVIA